MQLIVQSAQQPLKLKYKESPESALVVDHAVTSGKVASDPFHSTVEPMDGCGICIPVGVHKAVGGLHDAPTPGDLLCAALAACQDSSIRMVANLFGVELLMLEVRVTAEVDVRGTLGMSASVPVGFQTMNCEIKMRVKDGTSPELLSRLQYAAERCCVVQQTLKNPPSVATNFQIINNQNSD